MTNDTELFEVELVEKELISVELVEKELIAVDLTVVDLIPRKTYIWELEDIELADKKDFQVLVYNESTLAWENKYLSELIVSSESPTKINNKRFQTANEFITGTLLVFLNGLKEKEITLINTTTFEFKIDTVVSDTIEVSYIKQ